MFFKYEVVGNGFVLPTQLNQLFPPKYYTQKCLILTLKKQFFQIKNQFLIITGKKNSTHTKKIQILAQKS